MYGIFGAVIGDQSALSAEKAPDYVRSLFTLSESRGKEAAGLAIAGSDSIVVFKQPSPASEFIDTREFRAMLKRELDKSTPITATQTALPSLGTRYAVDFVPIVVEKRVGKSTVSMKTGFDTILLVLRLMTLFNPLRIFLPLSFLCFAAGVAWGIPHIIERSGITVGSMLAIITGVLLFGLGLICDQVAQMRLERYE